MKTVSDLINRLVVKRFFIVMMLGMICSLSAWADISTTSQQLDDFSFKKGLTAHGGLTFSNEFYSGSDSLVRRDPYAFFLNGNLNMNLWGISLPFSFSYSNTQISYTQPFNKFKLDPSYKWVHLLVGTNTMEMSPYTLSDHEFTGVGVELTPGKWKIAGMYGRLNKAVEYDPMVNNYNTVAFKRYGYAGMVGYNHEKGEYKVTFFHGEDDQNSLHNYIPAECALTPEKNTAVSASIMQRFLKYFFVKGEYAFTLFNSNICTDEGVEVQTNSFADRIFRKRISDKYADAINAALGYQGKYWGLSFNFERITPYYSTLGGYYFNNDLMNFTLAPNVKLLNGKLNLSGNFGVQYNNLDDDKQETTRRLVYSANIAYNSGKAFNTSLSFSNFSTFTKVRPTSYPYMTNSLDSLNFYQLSRSISSSSSLTFGSETLKDVLSLTLSYQCANMLTEEKLTSYSDYYASNLSFNQQVTPWKMSWSCFGNFNYCDATGMENIYFGPGLLISKPFFKDALTTSLSCAYNLNRVLGQGHGSLLNTSLSAAYSIKAANPKLGTHSFTLNSGYTRFLGAMANGDNQYEFLTTLAYRVSF